MTPKELAQACELAFNSVEQLSKEAKEREKGIKTMSEKKHTPGPWLSHGLAVATVLKWDAGNRNEIEIATVHCDENPVSEQSEDAGAPMDPSYCGREEAEANARLIAAAPDLLEALHDIIDPMGKDDIADVPQYEAAVKALAKAEGRS